MFPLSRVQYNYTKKYNLISFNNNKKLYKMIEKTSFETRVSRMGLGSYVDINIVMKY